LSVIDMHTEARRRGSVDVVDASRSISAPGVVRPSQPSPNSPHGMEFLPREMIRSTSDGPTTRRMSRKPVPHYDEANMEPHASQSNVEVSPFESPSIDADSSNSSVNSSRNPIHKSSSGDTQPVHYLIPDMPLGGNVQ